MIRYLAPIPPDPPKSAAERFAEADAAMAVKIAEQDKAKRAPRRDGISGKFRRK